MKTRRGAIYFIHGAAAPETHRRKRRKTAAEGSPAANLFEELPDDLVVSILADVAASAGSPADLTGTILTCKRFRELGQRKVVLSRASPRCLAVRAKKWSEDAHRFLQRCADAGNLDACYLLGMIRFYCFRSRGSGAALMAAAAVGGHREALYALAIIQFNGSGGSKDDRDLRVGAALCACAASLGHLDALRELGHCLQDGYGVRRSLLDGRRLLIQATSDMSKVSRRHSCMLSAANRFLVDWFASRQLGGGLRLCSQALCGRPETRLHEFRRCSVCAVVNYCSRACQVLHWKMAHKAECTPMDRWLNANAHTNAVAAAAVAAPAL